MSYSAVYRVELNYRVLAAEIKPRSQKVQRAFDILSEAKILMFHIIFSHLCPVFTYRAHQPVMRHYCKMLFQNCFHINIFSLRISRRFFNRGLIVDSRLKMGPNLQTLWGFLFCQAISGFWLFSNGTTSCSWSIQKCVYEWRVTSRAWFCEVT